MDCGGKILGNDMKTEKRHYIHELPDGRYEDCTEEEVAVALEAGKRYKMLADTIATAEKELHEIEKNCAHLVCYDEGGYIFHQRHCVVCGNIDLI